MSRADIFVLKIMYDTTPSGGVYMTSARIVDVMRGRVRIIALDDRALSAAMIYECLAAANGSGHRTVQVHVVEFSVVAYMLLYDMLWCHWAQKTGGRGLGGREFRCSMSSDGKISSLTVMVGETQITLKSIPGAADYDDDEPALVGELRRMRVRRMTQRSTGGFLLTRFSGIDEDTGEELYPSLSPAQYSFLSAAGRQGWKTDCAGDYADVEYWDFPSAYPTLLSTMSVPYGMPKTTEGRPPENPFWVGEVLMSWQPKTDCPAWFYPQRDYTGAPSRDSGDMEECYLTSEELAALRISHEVQVYGWGRVDGFECRPWAGLENRLWDWTRRQKKIGRGAVAAAAKRAINSVVGCYGRAPEVKRDFFELDPVTRCLTPRKEWLTSPRPAAYWPIYAAIVGRQRRRMVQLAVQLGGYVAYAHTDGVIVPSSLGGICAAAGMDRKHAFKRCRIYPGGGYVAEAVDGGLEYACSGLEKHSLDGLSYDDVLAGPVEVIVKNGRFVPGGKRVDCLLGEFNPMSGETYVTDDFGGKVDFSVGI